MKNVHKMTDGQIDAALQPPRPQPVPEGQPVCKYCDRAFKDLREHLKSCRSMKSHPDGKARTAFGDFLRGATVVRLCAEVNRITGIARKILRLLESAPEDNNGFLLLSGVARRGGEFRHLPSFWTVLQASTPQTPVPVEQWKRAYRYLCLWQLGMLSLSSPEDQAALEERRLHIERSLTEAEPIIRAGGFGICAKLQPASAAVRPDPSLELVANAALSALAESAQRLRGHFGILLGESNLFKPLKVSLQPAEAFGVTSWGER